MLTIWTDEQGRVRVDPGRFLRHGQALAGSRATWRVLCFGILGLWLFTLGAMVWAAARAEERSRLAMAQATTWLGEERARTQCLEALLDRVPPLAAEIVTVARRAQWVSRCVKRELERNS